MPAESLEKSNRGRVNLLDYNDLRPGEKVKVVVGGHILTGEIVTRSPYDPKEWIIRTFFHKELIALDETFIISKRRNRYFRNFFKKGTIVKVLAGQDEKVGIIIGSVNDFDGYSVYIPIVLIGDEQKMVSPSYLSVA